MVGFDPQNIRFCLMHVLHQGLAHFCNGGALLCLLNLGFFGPRIFVWASFLNLYIICCSAPRQPQNTPYNICCRVTPASGQPRDTLSNQLEELTVRFRRWIQANGIQWHISFEKGVWFFPMRYTLSIQRRHIYICVCVGSWGYST